jgi:prolyl-tRNA synthetase
VVIIPISKDKEVEDMVNKIYEELKNNDVRVFVDDSDKSPGFRFAEQEMNGIPLRIELGPRDLEKGVVTLARRDTYKKEHVKIDDNLVSNVKELLNTIQKDMFNKAKERNKSKTYECFNMDEVRKVMDNNQGFVKAMWCGDEACELKFKEIRGMKARCIVDEKPISNKCVCCGKKAKHLVYWGIQY